MKRYPEIPGPREAPGGPCVAFDKLDGSNLRFEFCPKRGWWRFGTRRRLFDRADPEYGRAIDLFLPVLGEGVGQVLRQKYPKSEAMAFCEFFGPNSFAGRHCWDDPFSLVLIDVSVQRRGVLAPEPFLADFGHLSVPRVMFRGDFTPELVTAVRTRALPVSNEGVVCKGVHLGKKRSAAHGLWMVKIKTTAWLAELRRRAASDPSYAATLADNDREQDAL